MNRTPPKGVLDELRREVGFACPVNGCGSPYLTWHHFDPPWRIENHHNPHGMIALCREHHDKADAGAFTKEQLRALKISPVKERKVSGKFDWMRQRLLVVLGDTFHYDNDEIFSINGNPIVWVERDSEGYLLLNIRMKSVEPEERLLVKNNIWLNIGSPQVLVSPPNGKLIEVSYENGDYLKIEFSEMWSHEDIKKKIGVNPLERFFDRAKDANLKYPEDFISFPLVMAEVHYRIAGTDIVFIPNENIFGNCKARGMLMIGGSIKSSREKPIFRENPSLLPFIPKRRLDACPCGSGLKFKFCHGLLK